MIVYALGHPGEFMVCCLGVVLVIYALTEAAEHLIKLFRDG